MTPFEATASRIASRLAGRDVAVECVTGPEWRILSRQYGFDRTLTWALTPLRRDSAAAEVPLGRSLLSPRACALAQAFSVAPSERGARLCRHGEDLVRRKAENGQRGKTGRNGTTVTVPRLGECDDWAAKLLAIHIVGHESMHLAGVVDEAAAECLSTQLGAFVAEQLGAAVRFSRSLAAEYWRYYYGSQDARYRSSDCRSGGALDLFPARSGWPTPVAYPASVREAIERFLMLDAAARSVP